MGDPPRIGIERMSPALAGRFSSNGTPGKPIKFKTIKTIFITLTFYYLDFCFFSPNFFNISLLNILLNYLNSILRLCPLKRYINSFTFTIHTWTQSRDFLLSSCSVLSVLYTCLLILSQSYCFYFLQ